MMGVLTRLPVIVSEAPYPRSALVVTSKGESTTASSARGADAGADCAKDGDGASRQEEMAKAAAEAVAGIRNFIGWCRGWPADAGTPPACATHKSATRE